MAMASLVIGVCLLLTFCASASASTHGYGYGYLKDANSPRYALKSYAQTNEPDTSQRMNLCDHCACTKNKVTCSFRHNKTLSPNWGPNYFVPEKIKSIEVYLKENTKFVLEKNFFQNNQVNYFGVNGVRNNDEVEVTENAFLHNDAGFPLIEFRKLRTVYLREKSLSGDEFKMLVDDCDELVVFSKAFEVKSLQLTVRDVAKFVQHKGAFSSHGSTKVLVTIHIENTYIPEIRSFDISMIKTTFFRCRIDSIQPNAFDVTSIKELTFEGCKIGTIKGMALTSKLHSDIISWVENVIGTIEGQAISHSGVTSLRLFNNTIERIKGDAIQIFAANTQICFNTVQDTQPNWLSIHEPNQVEIDNNVFKRFDQIQMTNARSQLNCSFFNNSLEDPQAGSLNFTGCLMHRIHVGRQCACNQGAWLTDLSHHDLDSEILCPLSERDAECFNATDVDRRRYVHVACGGTNITHHCVNGQWSEKPASFESGGFDSLSSNWIAGLVVTVVFFACLFIAFFAFITCRKRPASDVCSIDSRLRDQLLDESKKLSEKKLQQSIVGLCKGGYSRADCFKHTTKILGEVKDRESPVRPLLTEHLARSHPSSKGPVPFDSTAPSAPSPVPSDNEGMEEPIYHEVHEKSPLHPGRSVAVPSDYCDPKDPYEAPEHTYSDPVTSVTHASDMPPAYQYATPMRNHLPQTSLPMEAKYATPVWRSTPSATPTSRPPSGGGNTAAGPAPMQGQRHVRDLRQDLEGMAQFHPNQLTSARNQRQLLQNYPPPQQPKQMQQPPPYNGNGNGNRRGRRSFECLDGAASLAAMEHMDSGSDHSGGSDVTMQISDVIDYVDA